MKKNNGINWLTHNAIPIVLALLTWAVSFGVLKTDIEYLKKGQDELRIEFRSWKVQWEQRLGQAEIDIAVLENK